MLVVEMKLYLGDIGDRFVTVTGTVLEAFGDKSVKIHTVKWDHNKHRPEFDIKQFLVPTAILSIEEALIEKHNALGERYNEVPEDFLRDPADERPA